MGQCHTATGLPPSNRVDFTFGHNGQDITLDRCRVNWGHEVFCVYRGTSRGLKCLN